MVRSRHLAPIALAVLLVTAGCAGTLSGAAGNQVGGASEGGGGTTISVGASGEVTAEPDRAIVELAVIAVAEDPETARERVAGNVSALRDALGEAGIEDDGITTQHYAIREDRESRREGGGPTRYRAIHALRVDVQDVEAVGTIIETGVSNGATSVDRVQFTLSEESRSELRDRALGRAMDNARDNAEVLAANANLTITNVDALSTSDVHVSPYRAEAVTFADSAGTSIESGPVTVSAQVQVTYNATD